jgi:flagellin-like protein
MKPRQPSKIHEHYSTKQISGKCLNVIIRELVVRKGLSEIMGSLITTMIVISLFVVVYVTTLPALESFLGNAVYTTQKEVKQVQEDLVIEEFAVNLTSNSAHIWVANVGLQPVTITQVYVNGQGSKVNVYIGLSDTVEITVPISGSAPSYYVVVITSDGYSTSVTWS